MGLRLFSSAADNCDCSTKTVYVECEHTPKTVYIESSKLANPDPSNYRILSFEHIGNFLLVEIVYPDCKNFEGKKILLYHNVKIDDLGKRENIDPHFNDGKDAIYPVARFVPTDDGRKLAKKLAHTMSQP